MRKLAGLDASDDGQNELNDLVHAYTAWIESLEQNRPSAPPGTGSSQAHRKHTDRTMQNLPGPNSGWAATAGGGY